MPAEGCRRRRRNNSGRTNGEALEIHPVLIVGGVIRDLCNGATGNRAVKNRRAILAESVIRGARQLKTEALPGLIVIICAHAGMQPSGIDDEACVGTIADLV